MWVRDDPSVWNVVWHFVLPKPFQQSYRYLTSITPRNHPASTILYVTPKHNMLILAMKVDGNCILHFTHNFWTDSTLARGSWVSMSWWNQIWTKPTIIILDTECYTLSWKIECNCVRCINSRCFGVRVTTAHHWYRFDFLHLLLDTTNCNKNHHIHDWAEIFIVMLTFRG